jgi:hypothetical protein
VEEVELAHDRGASRLCRGLGVRAVASTSRSAERRARCTSQATPARARARGAARSVSLSRVRDDARVAAGCTPRARPVLPTRVNEALPVLVRAGLHLLHERTDDTAFRAQARDASIGNFSSSPPTNCSSPATTSASKACRASGGAAATGAAAGNRRRSWPESAPPTRKRTAPISARRSSASKPPSAMTELRSSASHSENGARMIEEARARCAVRAPLLERRSRGPDRSRARP